MIARDERKSSSLTEDGASCLLVAITIFETEMETMRNGKCVDGGGYSGGHLSRWASAALSQECENVRNASSRQANATLCSAAGALGQLVGAGALDRSHVEQELFAAALVRKIPAQEARATIASGLAWGTVNPRDLSNVGEVQPNNRAPIRPPASERVLGQDRNRDRARLTWEAAQPLSQTPAEKYLRNRGIVGNLPGSLRYIAGVAMPDGSRHEALIAAVTTVSGALVGIQRIAIRPDGSGKADIPQAKASLGSTSGGAVVLGDLTAAETVLEGEGVETVLSATQASGLPGIATLSAGTLGKPILPPNIRRVVVLGEHGSEGAAEIAAQRRREQGLEALIAYSTERQLKDANELLQRRGEVAVREWLAKAIRWDGDANDKKRSAPLPLIRELPQAGTFPVGALGELVGVAALAIHAMTGAPLAMCGTSVLGGVALVTQAHADVELPHGACVPLSLNLLAVGESGERKTTVDRLALKPIALREEELRQLARDQQAHYDNALAAWEAARKGALKSAAKGVAAMQAALDRIGPPPELPLGSVITCGEPTIEGLIKSLIHGQPSQGVFTAEGGEFVGGHALKDDAKLRSAAGLSKFWDGEPFKRTRADGVTIVAGRRVSMFLMVQPDVATKLCGDRVLHDQGFLARFLPTFPASTMGTRFSANVDASHGAALSLYHARMTELLCRAPKLKGGRRNELEPNVIGFTTEAAALLTAFADATEAELRKDGLLFSVRGFAAKLAEQAGRIAGGLSRFEDPEAHLIGVDRTEGAIVLAQYYAAEAMRLFGSAQINVDTMAAEDLRLWLLDRWDQETVSVRDIVRRGPNALRETSRVRHLVRILVDHGWLLPHHETKGRRDREVYQVGRGTPS